MCSKLGVYIYLVGAGALALCYQLPPLPLVVSGAPVDVSARCLSPYRDTCQVTYTISQVLTELGL